MNAAVSKWGSRLMLVASVAGWRATPQAPGPADGPPVPMTVQYMGCATQAQPRACSRRSETLTLSIEVTEAASVVVQAGAVQIAHHAPKSPLRLSVPVTEATDSVRVVALHADGRVGARWVLPLIDSPHPELLHAAALVREDPAQAKAAALAALSKLPPAALGRAHAVLGRAALREGDLPVALHHLEAALTSHLSFGRVHEAVWDGVALAFLHREAGADLVAARRVLDRLKDLPDGPLAEAAEAQGVLHQAAGQLELASGNLTEALAQLSAAEAALAPVASDTRTYASVLSDRGEALRRAGRPLEGAALHAAALRIPLQEGCLRPRLWSNLGWALMSASPTARAAAAADTVPLGARPSAYFARAAQVFEDTCPHATGEQQMVRVHAALAALDEGDADAALDQLAHPALGAATPFTTLAAVEGQPSVRRHIALARAQWELTPHPQAQTARAASLASAVVTDADARLDVEAADHARRLLAVALQRLGQTSQALKVHEEGLARAFQDAESLPATLGRGRFLAQRAAAARHHIALWLDAGHPEEALRVVRTFRAAALRSLYLARRLDQLDPEAQAVWDRYQSAYQQRRDAAEDLSAGLWRLSATERAQAEDKLASLRQEALAVLGQAFAPTDATTWQPRPPRAGELLVAWFALDDGWWVFAHDAHGVSATPVPAQDTPAHSRWWSPVAGQVARAEQVTLLPTGHLRHEDLHLRQVHGQPVIAQAQVAWGLDLPPRTEPAPTAQLRTLLVSDPRGDLPGAREEIGRAEALAVAEGQHPLVLRGRDATRDAVLTALPHIDVLHVASHGQTGDTPWHAELLLAEGTTLTVADVLASAKVPHTVLLSGCETAQVPGAALENLGLAQAFVTAGSEAAVAAARPVSDDAAAAFTTAWHRTAPGAPAARFAQAWRQTTQAHPDLDLSAFRLVRP